MKKTPKKRKTTTISCDESAREFIAAEAKRTGRLQREVLAEMISVYKLQKKRSATKAAEPQTQVVPGTIDMNILKDELSKVITKDVNRAISFIKEQEKIFLAPLATNVKSVKEQLENLE